MPGFFQTFFATSPSPEEPLPPRWCEIRQEAFPLPPHLFYHIQPVFGAHLSHHCLCRFQTPIWHAQLQCPSFGKQIPEFGIVWLLEIRP